MVYAFSKKENFHAYIIYAFSKKEKFHAFKHTSYMHFSIISCIRKCIFSKKKIQNFMYS